VGAIITPPLIVWLGKAYGWQAAFIIIGALGYIWLAIFWFVYYTPERSLKESKARIVPPLKLIKIRFVSWFTLSKVFMDPIWYFITFWIGRYLVEVHGWGLEKIGWFVMLPFIVADLGNIIGGLFTQFIIRKGVVVARARKISVAIFGMIMALSLILGPFVIVSPASALIVLSLAGFGYAAGLFLSALLDLPSGAVVVWALAVAGTVCFALERSDTSRSGIPLLR